MLSPNQLSIYFALAANLSFSVAIIYFTQLSKVTSSLWMNTAKAIVALFFFVATVTLFLEWQNPSFLAFTILIVSGGIGLAFADLLLLKAFTLIGPSRSMVLFGFQPLLVGFASLILFGQELPPDRLIAVIFLCICLFVFSYENYRKDKKWQFRGLILAVGAMFFDGLGILLTRYAFDLSPSMHSFEGNVYRCLGALLGFFLISRVIRPIRLKELFFRLSYKLKWLFVLASFLGTFVSLAFYLEAIKYGNLASITAISITTPIFSAAIEFAVARRWPSREFFIAFLFFAIGFYFLNT